MLTCSCSPRFFKGSISGEKKGDGGGGGGGGEERKIIKGELDTMRVYIQIYSLNITKRRMWSL